MVYFYQLFLNTDYVILMLYTSLCQKAKCTLFVWSTVGKLSTEVDVFIGLLCMRMHLSLPDCSIPRASATDSAFWSRSFKEQRQMSMQRVCWHSSTASWRAAATWASEWRWGMSLLVCFHYPSLAMLPLAWPPILLFTVHSSASVGHPCTVEVSLKLSGPNVFLEELKLHLFHSGTTQMSNWQLSLRYLKSPIQRTTVTRKCLEASILTATRTYSRLCMERFAILPTHCLSCTFYKACCWLTETLRLLRSSGDY